MITHIYRFADKDIQISSIYEYVHHYCVDYRVSGMPDFSVTTSVEDIEYEREKSRRDDLAEGRVTEADIDKACRRILEAKYKLGLFENPFKYLDANRSVKEIYTPEHLAFARKAAQESMVLLKNNGVLPLSKNQRVAVVGPLAQNAAAMAGAWSMSAHNDACVTPYQGIAEIAPASYAEGSWLFKDKELEESVRFGLYKIFMPGYKAPAIHTIPQERLIAEAVAKARQADVVVACVGEIETLNGEGASRTDISIPDAQKDRDGPRDRPSAHAYLGRR